MQKRALLSLPFKSPKIFFPSLWRKSWVPKEENEQGCFTMLAYIFKRAILNVIKQGWPYDRRNK